MLGIKFLTETNLEDLYEKMKNIKKKDLEKSNKKRNKAKSLKIGDKVYCKSHNIKKTDNIWIGPFKIVNSKANDNIFLVDKGTSSQWYSIRHLRKQEGGEYCDHKSQLKDLSLIFLEKLKNK